MWRIIRASLYTITILVNDSVNEQTAADVDNTDIICTLEITPYERSHGVLLDEEGKVNDQILIIFTMGTESSPINS